MKYNEELIEELRAGKIVVKGTSRVSIQGVLDYAFPGDLRMVSVARMYYCIAPYYKKDDAIWESYDSVPIGVKVYKDVELMEMEEVLLKSDLIDHLCRGGIILKKTDAMLTNAILAEAFPLSEGKSNESLYYVKDDSTEWVSYIAAPSSTRIVEDVHFKEVIPEQYSEVKGRYKGNKNFETFVDVFIGVDKFSEGRRFVCRGTGYAEVKVVRQRTVVNMSDLAGVLGCTIDDLEIEDGVLYKLE